MGCSESYHKWLGTMNPSDLPIMKFHDKARRAELAICGNLRALRIYIALCGVWVCVYTGGRHDKKHIKTSISHPDWKSSAFFQRLRYHRQHLQVNAPAFQRLPALKLRDIDLKPFVHNLGGGIIERLTLWILSPRETLENPISIVHCPILPPPKKKKTYHSPFHTIPLKLHMPIIYVKYREIGGLLLKGVAFYLDPWSENGGEEITAQGSSTCHGRSFFVLDLRSWDSPDSGDGVLEAFLEKSWLITTLSPFKHIKCFGEDKHFKHFSNNAYKIPLYRYFGKVLNMFLMWHFGPKSQGLGPRTHSHGERMQFC